MKEDLFLAREKQLEKWKIGVEVRNTEVLRVSVTDIIRNLTSHHCKAKLSCKCCKFQMPRSRRCREFIEHSVRLCLIAHRIFKQHHREENVV